MICLMENGPVSYISIKLKGTESKYSENKIQLFETIMIFCLCEFCSIVCKNSMNTAQYLHLSFKGDIYFIWKRRFLWGQSWPNG